MPIFGDKTVFAIEYEIACHKPLGRIVFRLEYRKQEQPSLRPVGQ